MLHLDLFSGIGGFALAVDTVYGKKAKHIFVENDPFCQAVLKKHWPDAEYHSDIREFVTDAKRQGEPQSEGYEQDKREWPCDLITGGFPCQPFSHAGRRQGTADDRYLWPPMFDAIALFRPTWVIAENVAGLVTWNDGMVLETVCTDLESEGYEVQPFIIPAVAVGAAHRRDRVWIVAHRNVERSATGYREVQETHGKVSERYDDAESSNATVDNAPDADPANDFGRGSRSSSDRQRVEKDEQTRKRPRSEFARRGENNWAESWLTAATRLCTVDDGLPDGLVRPRGWRNAALKAAGNAIVPQVAMEILHSIKSS